MIYRYASGLFGCSYAWWSWRVCVLPWIDERLGAFESWQVRWKLLRSVCCDVASVQYACDGGMTYVSMCIKQDGEDFLQCGETVAHLV